MLVLKVKIRHILTVNISQTMTYMGQTLLLPSYMKSHIVFRLVCLHLTLTLNVKVKVMLLKMVLSIRISISKMDHELIGDKVIVVVEAYASCRGCNIIPRSGILSDNELCS